MTQTENPPNESPGATARAADARDWASIGCIAALWAFVAIWCAYPVPHGSESVYLMAPLRLAQPALLAHDFTFANGGSVHRLFDYTLSLFMSVASPETVAILGRGILWAAHVALLFAIGRQMGLGRLPIAAAIVAWIVTGQTLYGGDWLFATIEAKIAAYGFALGGLLLAMRGRPRLAALCMGLAFSFHVSVGLSFGFGLLIGDLFIRRRPKDLAIDGVVGIAGCLPGLIVGFRELTGGSNVTLDGWRTVVKVYVPHHLDAGYFANSQMLASALMLAFCLLQARTEWENSKVRFLAGFEIGIALVTAGGFVVTAIGRYDLLRIFPFRVFPLLIGLLFFLHLFRAYSRWRIHAPGPLLAGLAAFSLMLFPSPVVTLRSHFEGLVAERARTSSDEWNAYRWIRASTPIDAIVITDPSQRVANYVMQRSEIASPKAVAWGALPEWFARVEALGGPVPPHRPLDLRALGIHYRDRTPDEVLAIRRRYGGDFFVSHEGYPFPVAERQGKTVVYDLRAAGPELSLGAR